MHLLQIAKENSTCFHDFQIKGDQIFFKTLCCYYMAWIKCIWPTCALGLYQHIYSAALNTAVKQWVKEEGCVVLRALLHFLTQSTCLHSALLTGNHSSISHFFFPMLVRFLGMSERCSLLKKQQKKKKENNKKFSKIRYKKMQG